MARTNPVAFTTHSVRLVTDVSKSTNNIILKCQLSGNNKKSLSFFPAVVKLISEITEKP